VAEPLPEDISYCEISAPRSQALDPRLYGPKDNLERATLKISLFITCYNDTLFPETGKAAVRVLERLGHAVEFWEAQTCCGQMHYNTGYRRDAVEMMRRFLRVFSDAEIVCIPSSSCVAMIREQNPKLASGHSALETDVRTILPRIFEFPGAARPDSGSRLSLVHHRRNPNRRNGSRSLPDSRRHRYPIGHCDLRTFGYVGYRDDPNQRSARTASSRCNLIRVIQL
jgi:hypothetical protein